MLEILNERLMSLPEEYRQRVLRLFLDMLDTFEE